VENHRLRSENDELRQALALAYGEQRARGRTAGREINRELLPERNQPAR
jgi:hypothetical protein